MTGFGGVQEEGGRASRGERRSDLLADLKDNLPAPRPDPLDAVALV